MAKYELSSARKDDLENTERDIFAPKSRNPEGAELVAACESEIEVISVTCLSFIKQTMRHGKPAGRPSTS